jgi:hypothetical protein
MLAEPPNRQPWTGGTITHPLAQNKMADAMVTLSRAAIKGKINVSSITQTTDQSITTHFNSSGVGRREVA